MTHQMQPWSHDVAWMRGQRTFVALNSGAPVDAFNPDTIDTALVLGVSTEALLNSVPLSDVLSSFIRGIFDDCGWMTHVDTFFDLSPIGMVTFGMTTKSYELVVWLKQSIEQAVGVRVVVHDLMDDTYTVQMSGKDDWVKFFQWLYEHSTPDTRNTTKYAQAMGQSWMQCYIIPPIKELTLTHLGHRYFCLAHFYVQYEEYRTFFLSLSDKCHITLDNSAAEKSLVTEQVLLDIVRELRPDEVIAPDVLFDKDATLQHLESFTHKMWTSGLLEHTKIFGCPQGANQQEWLECYQEMLNNPQVSVIGLSKIAIPKCWLNEQEWDVGIDKARHTCVEYLIEHDLVKKQLHFLGMGDPREFSKYSHTLFRSTDSCYTVLAAVNGIDFSNSNFDRIKTYDEYYHMALSAPQLLTARKNIAFLKYVLEFPEEHTYMSIIDAYFGACSTASAWSEQAPLTIDTLRQAANKLKNTRDGDNKWVVIDPQGQIYSGTHKDVLAFMLSKHELFIQPATPIERK